jgi:hypothetical protein
MSSIPILIAIGYHKDLDKVVLKKGTRHMLPCVSRVSRISGPPQESGLLLLATLAVLPLVLIYQSNIPLLVLRQELRRTPGTFYKDAKVTTSSG